MAFLYHVPNGMGIVVDHKDNIKTNNFDFNLQLITQRLNTSKNTKSSSKYPGVHWNKINNNWRAQIRINGKAIHLGSFDTEEEAAQAYQQKLRQHEN